VYAAFSARGAVVASLLAASGLSGVPRLFEGPYGFFATYFPDGYDREPMMTGLGTDFTGSGTLYKPWPSVGTSHSHIHATIQLVTEHELAADDIAEIRCRVGDYHALMCTPLAERQRPATLADARFSLPFLVAAAAVHRRLGIVDFSPAALADPLVLATAQKVVPVPDSALDWTLELPPGEVEIVTVDGRSYHRTGHGVPGTPESPLTWNDILAKFRDCAAASINPPSLKHLATVEQHFRSLEGSSDATQVLHLLAGHSTTASPTQSQIRVYQ
jgi:2-methylcitrate dehydratase PrpD